MDKFVQILTLTSNDDIEFFFRNMIETSSQVSSNPRTTEIVIGSSNADGAALKNDNANASEERNDSVSHTLLFRAMITFQVFAYGSYSVLVHLCEREGVIMFSSTVMNLVLEMCKLSLSIALHFTQSNNTRSFNVVSISWLRRSLPYSIPGLLYFITNNLAVHIQLEMDPASYQILSNFKIVTTAVLYRIIIKQKLTRRKWFAVWLLFFAGLFYSLGKLFQHTHIDANSN
jgi:predicted membrane channel-forming protein YqfA (hemolysin III family)